MPKNFQGSELSDTGSIFDSIAQLKLELQAIKMKQVVRKSENHKIPHLKDSNFKNLYFDK